MFKATSFAALLTSCLFAGACHDGGPDFEFGNARGDIARIVGLLPAKAGDPCDAVLVDLSDIEINHDPKEARLKFNDRFESLIPLVLEVEYTATDGTIFDYKAVLASAVPGGGVSARLVLEMSSEEGIREPRIYLDEGALLIWHNYPRARTKYVSLGSEGTTVAVEHEPGGVDRIYLIKGDRLTVTCMRSPFTTTPTTAVLTTEGNYFECTSISGGLDCAFTEKSVAIHASPAQQALILCLKSLALTAGWDEGP